MSTIEPFVIYPARKVITMNRSYPVAEAVAVVGDRILGVGTVDELSRWGEHTVDNSFANQVIAPGFVEAHSHVMGGGMWQFPYVGYFDRSDPDGRLWAGSKNIAEVVSSLQAIEAEMEDPDQPLIAWGLDPIYFDGERMVASHLDQVSTTREIFVYHASGHLATVNTALMEAEGITIDTPTPGVARDSSGHPNGELQEPAAMILAGRCFRTIGQQLRTPAAMWKYAHEARNTGTTTLVDLGTSQLADPVQLQNWREATSHEDYPARVMVAMSNAFGGQVNDPTQLAQLGADLKAESTDKLHFGIVKIVLDGSIQGFSARVSWPHYIDAPEGHSGNGLWLIAPDQMADLVTTYHAAGLTVHCHCNGDEAAEVFIDAVEAALERHPRWDHRHTVQHCQLTRPAQYRRMAALGMCANIFSNHMFYWGDQHRDTTVGHERAFGMDACATAAAEGVSFSIHSDAPVTPMGHLHTMWCAVNRFTSTGEVLGEHERISVEQALHAVTLGAAFQIKLDHEVGSLEAGKRADFAVLDEDPLEVAPEALKDIGVWGTVVGGKHFPAGPGD